MALPQFKSPDDRRSPAQYYRVELLDAEQTRKGDEVPAGSRGTIVEVLTPNVAFLVEFLEPIAAVVPVSVFNLRIAQE